ncbi:hypothetical protein Krac_9568 [Ktedonobacter racemifer DSM 44963]|uniref:Uncharacterized protein n=1 Tax=Ktedonobacter racemifer DSM 44963 TaxID=485913 RepID=D6TCP8_KTERA|nr:hypothetical protein Krac_9568 [Ktedonobacter racemifer DSM 44963]
MSFREKMVEGGRASHALHIGQKQLDLISGCFWPIEWRQGFILDADFCMDSEVVCRLPSWQ